MEPQNLDPVHVARIRLILCTHSSVRCLQVFRTYNASQTLQEQLDELSESESLAFPLPLTPKCYDLLGVCLRLQGAVCKPVS